MPSNDDNFTFAGRHDDSWGCRHIFIERHIHVDCGVLNTEGVIRLSEYDTKLFKTA